MSHDRPEAHMLPICPGCKKSYDPYDIHKCVRHGEESPAPFGEFYNPPLNQAPLPLGAPPFVFSHALAADQVGWPDWKETNPKDAIGSDKLPLHLVPASLEAYASLAFLEGALKYGKFNWRIAGVRLSIYIDALKRHTKKLEDGEWDDAKTGVPHLASIIACAGIPLDAKECGKLTDDRAPRGKASELIDRLAAQVVKLKNLFKDHNPKQYTIADGVEE